MSDAVTNHSAASPADARVLSVTITEAGRTHAARLPYPAHHGQLAETVRARWGDLDALVLFCALGAATRIVGPLLSDKHTDPAVVVIDEAGRFAVPLTGGHRPGPISANDLATEIGGLLDAQPVITTATDASDTAALDTLPGFAAQGDVAGVSRALLDGEPIQIDNPAAWPLPTGLPSSTEGAVARIVITDRSTDVDPTTAAPETPAVRLFPPSLVVGVGASTNAPGDAATRLLDEALAKHGLARDAIGTIATVDRRAADPVVTDLATDLGVEVRAFTPEQLATIAVPNPSEVVAAEIGTASVAEAAALAAAGPGAELVVEKRKGTTATLAIARRSGPVGEVSVVGLGPGHVRHRTPEAVAAIRGADVVIGYSLYVEQCTDLTSAGQEVVHSPIGAEVDRCAEAVRRAAAGQRVALVCSGDPGVFAMATLVLELAPEHGDPPVRITPGVTASLAAGAILGAPLAHDHALVSLSDLLTPWPLIERRLEALATADMAVALYNPRSRRRTMQLERAREILLGHRPPSTPVGVVVNATRPDQRVLLTTLDALDPAEVDMFSIVVIGSSTTRIIGGRMVTPRGYTTGSEGESPNDRDQATGTSS